LLDADWIENLPGSASTLGSAIRDRQSTLDKPQSAICNLQSAMIKCPP
jgi:hypothetical protein